jgi:hypothetical protein
MIAQNAQFLRMSQNQILFQQVEADILSVVTQASHDYSQ